MNVVAYGGGTDSTAMLIMCWVFGIKIDLILFADTGAEKPHTYEYIKIFSKWLVEHGMPPITIVKNLNESKKDGLEALCLKNKTLPSIAYGFKSCSVQFKIEPVDKYLKTNYSKEWDDNGIIKFIGYDASEDRRAKESPNEHYKNRFPLIEWNIDRDMCLEIIKEAGLPQAGKSACFFCPSSKPGEVRNLKLQYPELAKKAIEMENNAELTSIKGLGRNWAWRDLLATDDMFDDPSYTLDIACGCYDG